MKKVIAILLTILIAFSCCSCGKKKPANADKTFKFHLESEPNTLDPQVASDSPAIIAIGALYEGLVRLDKENKPYAGVAKTWTSNQNNTSFTFELRKDAVWSNGDPVTAHDFVYAFQRAVSPATNSQTCEPLFCIKNAKQIRMGKAQLESLGATAKDDHTLMINLEYPYKDFPVITASAPFMPCNKKYFEGTQGKYGLEVKTVLGNGPFTITNRYSWEHNKFLNLTRSSKYKGENEPLPSALNFTIGSNEEISDPINALKDNKTDAIEIPSSSVSAAKAAKLELISYEDTTWGLCFNLSNELMKNIGIRKAFVQTLDRKALLQHLPNNCSTADDIITPGTTFMGKKYRSLAGSGMYAKQSNNSLTDLNTALKSLSMTKLPAVTVLGPDDKNSKLMLNDMITSWNVKLGSYFNMQPLANNRLMEKIASGDYEIALCPLRPIGDGPMQLLSIFQSTSNENPANLKDTTYDTYLKQAENQNGMNSLNSYVAAEKYLNEQFIFYPIYYQNRYFASGNGVTGIVFHPYDMGIDFIQAGKE